MEIQEEKKRGRKKIIKPVEEEEVVVKEEPKKRGRKKKEVLNELVEKIQDMKIEDFMEEKETPEAVEIQKGIECMHIEEENEERNERRELKSMRYQKVTKESGGIYYLYLCKRRLGNNGQEYDEEKIQKMIFLYQVFLYGRYENDIILFKEERSDIDYEDEIEMIHGQEVVKIRMMKESFINKIQEEIQKDRWNVLNLMYRIPKVGKITDSEICRRILDRDEFYLKGVSEKRIIDHNELLKRKIYYVDMDELIESSFTMRDVIEKCSEMNEKMKSESMDIKK